MMNDRLRELLAINRAITGTLDRQEILDLLVDKTMQLTDAEACALLLSEGDDEVVLAAHRGLDDEVAASFSARFNERINADLRQLFDHESEHCFLAVPIVRNGSVRGLLAIHGGEESWDDPEFRMMLTALADQAAIALDQAGRYRELWQESQQARGALETASRRKDEFLAMLAHELRNPLAAIVNAIEVLQLRASGDDELERVRAIASRQARHMKRLLDDLLEVSRVTQGKIELHSQRVDLAEVVRQALDTTAPLIEEHRHTVHWERPATPAHVDGDADRLIEVVSNLLSNSAKYTPPGGNISLAVHCVDDQAEIRVRDDGMGIPDELRDSLFDLFVQMPQAPNRPGGGLGIGLTLVRQLVKLHGGTVEARSAGVGKGSEFVVRLPLSDGPDSGIPTQAETHAPAKQRILLVEDNPDAADMLSFALGAEGHEVHIARDGRAALAASSKRLPDVVLVDIGLPDMDGVELTRRLREAHSGSSLVIIALSGYGDERRQREAYEAGVDHYVLKPVNAQDLSRLLAPRSEA